ncbi:MAG: hypothetical protein FWD45_02870 [Coriobacteriia bacterium]|nr:hypothetical protein [Coriobacteriia bacterium]
MKPLRKTKSLLFVTLLVSIFLGATIGAFAGTSSGSSITVYSANSTYSCYSTIDTSSSLAKASTSGRNIGPVAPVGDIGICARLYRDSGSLYGQSSLVYNSYDINNGSTYSYSYSYSGAASGSKWYSYGIVYTMFPNPPATAKYPPNSGTIPVP